MQGRPFLLEHRFGWTERGEQLARAVRANPGRAEQAQPCGQLVWGHAARAVQGLMKVSPTLTPSLISSTSA